MFIIGAVAGVVIGGIVCSGDDDDDYRDWSEYSDAGMVQQVEQAKARERQTYRQLERSKQELKEVYQSEMAKLKENYGDIPENPDSAEEFLDKQQEILNQMRDRLTEESNEAQKKVQEIDEAINAINKIQLTEMLK